MRDAARALAKEEHSDQNGGLHFLNAIADMLKHKLGSEEEPEEIPGIGEEDDDESLDLAEMIKHAIRKQLLGDLKNES